jgi:3'-phosphoadenosine 5'-phosphosulfate sulfotransferase (PAPS reductase)/FAD synthetase
VTEKLYLEGRTLDDAIDDAYATIDRAISEYGPTISLVMFSGGDDSNVLLHLCRSYMERLSVLHINTGIGIEETREFAFTQTMNLDLRWYECRNPRPDPYDRIVLTYGFPGPAMHRTAYVRLKERALEEALRKLQTGDDLIMLLTGVRSTESRRRMGHSETIRKMGRKLWVNPLHHFDGAEMRAYRERFALKRNPVSAKLGLSGECLCGAFATPWEFSLIDENWPTVADRIRALEKQVADDLPGIQARLYARWEKRMAEYRVNPYFKNGKRKPLPKLIVARPKWGPGGELAQTQAGPLCACDGQIKLDLPEETSG